jgi:hypothetical protein
MKSLSFTNFVPIFDIFLKKKLSKILFIQNKTTGKSIFSYKVSKTNTKEYTKIKIKIKLIK